MNLEKLKGAKVLVVYYSLEGHCQRLAKYLCDAYGFDSIHLQPLKDLNPNSPSKHWIGRLQVLFNQTVAIQQLPTTLEDYDLVLLGTPVWQGSCAPAVLSFVSELPLNGMQVGLFSTYERDAGEVFIKLEERLKKAKIVGEISINVAAIDADDFKDRMDNWLYSLLS